MIQSVTDQGYFDIRIPEVQQELKKVIYQYASSGLVCGMFLSLFICGIFGTLISFVLISIYIYYIFKSKKDKTSC